MLVVQVEGLSLFALMQLPFGLLAKLGIYQHGEMMEFGYCPEHHKALFDALLDKLKGYVATI